MFHSAQHSMNLTSVFYFTSAIVVILPHESPFELFKGRLVKQNLLCLQSVKLIFYLVKDYHLSSALKLKNLGKQMYRILDIDLSVHHRHFDQLLFEELSQSVPNPAISLHSGVNTPTFLKYMSGPYQKFFLNLWVATLDCSTHLQSAIAFFRKTLAARSRTCFLLDSGNRG